MPRKKEGAYIFRRKGRRGWYAYLNRQERAISLKTEDEQEAQAGLSLLLEESSRFSSNELDEKETSIADIFKIVMERAPSSHTPKYAADLQWNLKRILSYLLTRKIYIPSQIDKDAVEKYKTWRRSGDKAVGEARVNRELDSFRKAMKVAIEMRCARAESLSDFVKLREPKPAPHQRGLTSEDLRKFFLAVEHRYRCVYRTVMGAGLRSDELNHLDISDIKSAAIVVTPKKGWTTKSYHYRTIPASPETIRAAYELVVARNSRIITLEKKKVWRVIGEACDAAGIKPRFSLQDLRRAWGSHMLKAGHGLQQISQWYGHKDVITTMRYLRVVDEMPSQDSLPW